MCGIAGIVHPEGKRDVDAGLLRAMATSLTHRGPDDEGFFLSGSVGLAHRRLSIVDLAMGHQPMTNEDGSLQIVFNGEIYNHADYRVDLQARGHVFSTHSDTETIVHLFEEYGSRCVDYLRGMFAFAVWSKRSRELFIARDRLGVKPLYYVHQADGSLYFASEIKALLAARAIRAELNVSALPDYLANRATFDDSTLFSGVRRLPAGHTLRWKDGKINIERYWDANPDRSEIDSKRPDADYVEEWYELFKTSVRLRLMSDVPLGMFLSGGIDSSAIAAVMSKMVTDPIKTFSVAFDVPEANELEYARLVSRTFRTDHHEVLVQPGDFAAALPHLIWHEDEPIAHSASVPLYFVSKLAQQYVKVVLTGEGSDELLAGYSRYRTTTANLAAGRIYHRATTESMRRLVRTLSSGLAPRTFRQKLSRTFLWRAPDVDALYFDNFSVFSQNQQLALLTRTAQDRVQGVSPYASMHHFFDAYPSASLLQKLLYTDVKTYLHELLMKQDQMSMAASIESRVPFLDHKLVEYSMALPERMKLRGWKTKYVLRKAMTGVLPDVILKRRKMGFPVPLDRWFREDFQPLLNEHLLSKRALARGYFQPEYLKKMVHEHASGVATHTDRLWTLLNLEMWQRQFIDGEPIATNLPQVMEAPCNR